MDKQSPHIRPTFGSHIKVLEEVCALLGRPACLEFGPGPYSTPLLLRHASRLISVEHDPVFAGQLSALSPAGAAHEVAIEPNLSLHVGIAQQHAPFDLVFIDGAREVRADLVLATLDLSRIVIAHDTDKQTYHWEKLDVLDSDARVDFTADPPWTSVFSRDHDLLDRLRALA